MKRIGVITSGGDAPGMNTAIRAVVREAVYRGMEVVGVKRGYIGLLDNDIEKMDRRSVSGIINQGGTILRTGRCKEIRTEEGIKKAVKVLKERKIEGLVVIGGDGSMAAGAKISEKGIPVVCIPASIDNDVYGTDETIGFDTAIDTAIEAIDKIRDTAASHERVFVIEVMGREHGFLAAAIGAAAGAEYVIIPEKRYNEEDICRDLEQQRKKGKSSIIIIYAEGAGNVREFADKLKCSIDLEVRVSSLGYIQRGGSPSARSRILASMFGVHAVELLSKGKKNRLVAIQNNKITDVPFALVKNNEKKIDKSFLEMVRRLSR